MKKIIILFTASIMTLTACNNSGDTADSSQKKTADSLYDEVMDGHDVGMAKMGKLESAQNEVNRLIDSIGKLPAAAQQAAASLKSRLDSLKAELDYAGTAMDKWMVEMSWDSAENNLEKRIKYLTEEKLKVNQVRDNILNGLQKADTLLRSAIK
jgi:hypothetical protein